jgi:hypothetical protein
MFLNEHYFGQPIPVADVCRESHFSFSEAQPTSNGVQTFKIGAIPPTIAHLASLDTCA